MRHLLSILIITLFLSLFVSCSSYQPVKNVWKTTKGMWNTYVSTPATVDYEEKGSLSPQGLALANSVKGIDEQLHKLERAMQNADKPPTQAWLDNLFATFPWLNGFAGIKYDGTILGQQPADSLKELDFNPLLYEDKKQNSRALRADIQPSPLGPEIMLATPLYDGIDFLGIVVAYFDMRSLTQFSQAPDDMVILSPTALLWPGKFDYAATPLAGVDWTKTVLESSAGTCSNDRGTFYYIVRYLGNLPLVFAIPEKGEFPEGNGDISQGAAFFPQERAKLPPPPLPERKPRREHDVTDFARKDEDELEAEVEAAQESVQEQPATARSGRSPNEIQPGSSDSVLLRKGQGRGRQLEERQLEGENVPVQQPRRQTRRQIIIEQPVEREPEPTTPIKRPSPFGPEESAPVQEKEYVKPSPFGPEPAPQVQETQASPAPESARPQEAEKPSVETGQTNASPPERPEGSLDEASPERQRKPARMPDGRPSPFGPED